MSKQYNFEAVTPDMKGGINYWAKVLEMGAANIRTAIRNKKLNGVLVPLREGNDDIKTYSITGDDILKWRAEMHTTTGTERKIRDAYKYKTSVAIKVEDAERANAALKAAGIEFTLVKPAPVARKAGGSKAKAGNAEPAIEDIAPLPEPPAKTGLFGRK